MNRARGFRGLIATVFVVGSAGVGVGLTATSVGAGVPPPNGDGIQCEVEDGGNGGPVVIPTQNGRVVNCAQLEVTKVVTGTPQPSPPPGTMFDVVVDCVPSEDGDIIERGEGGVTAQQEFPQAEMPPFTTTLTFPAEGGTQSVFVDRPADCTVTETPPAGCTLTFVDPETTEIRQPILYPVTVSNNCDPAQPAPEAAVAVVEAPRFTG